MVEVHTPSVAARGLNLFVRGEWTITGFVDPQAGGGHRCFRDPLAMPTRVAPDPLTVAAAVALHASMLETRQPYAVVHSTRNSWR